MAKRIESHRRIFILVGFILAVCILITGRVKATSDNRQHELGVYSLYEYGIAVTPEYPDGTHWKSTVEPYFEMNPSGLFWQLMTNGSSSEAAHDTSKLRVNEQVNIHTIFPIAGDGWKDWDQFDMVFFYGHNNMITPPHPDRNGSFWSNQTGSWRKVVGPYQDWGTAAIPYEYYYEDITTGIAQPGSVTYLWEPFTSALFGYHYNPDYVWIVQTRAQEYPDGNVPASCIECTGGLGTNDLEWLFFNGCQALIVANADGSEYLSLGVDAFRQTWDGFHIVMGHYHSFGMGGLPDLSPLADGLRSGIPVQAAYFLTEPSTYFSAISAEYYSDEVAEYISEETYLTHGSYMNNDTWTDPREDIPENFHMAWIRPNIWYVKWIQTVGSEASEWE